MSLFTNSLQRDLSKPQSLKAFLTQIFIFLRRHKSTLERKFSPQRCDSNLSILCELFESVSKLCDEIITKYGSNVVGKSENLKPHIFNAVFNKNMMTLLYEPLRHYCEIVFQWFENPTDTSHCQLLERTYKIMSSSPIVMENVFTDVFLDITKAYLKTIICSYNNEYHIKLLDNLMDINSNLIDKQIIPNLFPQTHKNANHKFNLSTEIKKIYFDTRSASILDIVTEYPSSIPTIDDLRKCILILGNGIQLCSKLKSEIDKQLLHPAITTPNLITAYISIIRALRRLDTQYLFEEFVTPEMKSYMQLREDIHEAMIDKILTLDENESMRNGEMDKSSSIKLMTQDGYAECGDVKCTLEEMYNWNPEPIDSFGVRSLWYRPVDVLSLMFSIYGSGELFASEYKKLLSQRLLKNLNFDIGKEMRNLETLKLKFGQDFLRDCHVMLKDIVESQRINNIVEKKLSIPTKEPKFDIQSFIISAQYWSALTDKEFQLPDKLQNQFDNYTKVYSDHKPKRGLKWYHAVGIVDLTLELNNTLVNLQVTPLQATVIYSFSEKPRWELVLLAQNLKLNVSVVRRAINFWVQKEVLKRVKEHGLAESYITVENDDNNTIIEKKKIIDIDDDSEDDTEKTHFKKEMYQNVWITVKFILSRALTLKQTMDIDKLFATLMIYTSGEPIRITKEQLEIFLYHKVAEMDLVIDNGNYLINKSKL